MPFFSADIAAGKMQITSRIKFFYVRKYKTKVCNIVPKKRFFLKSPPQYADDFLTN